MRSSSLTTIEASSMSWCSSASSVRSSVRHDEVERAERLLLEPAQLVLEVQARLLGHV